MSESEKGGFMDWTKLSSGIRYRKHATRKAAKTGVKKDRYFLIYFRIGKNLISEGLGWESEGWSEERVKILYNELKQNRKIGKGPKTYKEKLAEERRQEEERKTAEIAAQEQAQKEGIRFVDIFKDYIKLSETDKAANTARRERYLFRDYIEPYIGNDPVKNINKGHVENIKAEAIKKDLSAATINLILATLRQILNFAIDRNLISENPVSRVKKLKLDNRRVRFLTEDQAESLLKAIKAKSVDTYRISLFSLHMGLRAGEIFNLTWADIDQENGTLFIKDTKTGHNRHAYMTDRIRAEIKDMKKGQGNDLVFPPREYAKSKHMQLVSRTFNRCVNDLKLNEGIEDPRQKIVFHSMRHTFASWLVQKGVSIYAVKELLGHQTLTMTERYSHIAADHLRQAAAILDGQNNVIPFPKQEVGNK